MADSQREALVDAIVAALGAVGKPSGLTVHRRRSLPLTADNLPSTVVYSLEEDVSHPLGGDDPLAVRRLTVRLEHRVQSTDPEGALDPLVQWGTAELLADPTLGGRCTDLFEKKLEWDAVTGEKAYGACAQDFEIIYQTVRDDQTSAA